MPSSRNASGVRTWLSLGPASRLLGVGPDTLRRWADQGRIESFQTPGGHRRFSRRALERLVADTSQGHASLARLGATSERLVSAYRRRYVQSRRDARSASAAAQGDAPNPVRAVKPADHETFRVEGRQLIDALVAYLEAAGDGSGETAPATAALAQASALVEALGSRLAHSGVNLADAVTLFVAARRPLLDELAALGRRRGLSAREFAGVYARALTALDQLLVVLVRAHRATGQLQGEAGSAQSPEAPLAAAQSSAAQSISPSPEHRSVNPTPIPGADTRRSGR